MDKAEKKIGKRKVKVHKIEGLYPYVRLEDFMFVVKQLEEENKKLKEEIETLNMRLDNKEKLNEEYRKQIDKYKEQYQHSMGFSDFGGYDD